MNVTPIFKSHYSGGLFTFDSSKDAEKYFSKSIFPICRKNGISSPVVVEKNMTGFAELFEKSKTESVNPIFGLEYFFSHSSEPNTFHKIVIFLKNTDGYKNLIRIHNLSNRNNNKIISPEILVGEWSDDLKLAIPFYDSYIFKNTLIPESVCLPEFGEIEQNFICENNRHPFDCIIKSKLPKIDLNAKTVYYENRSDFKIWMTYKCSLNYLVKGKKRTLREPNFEHLHSKEFCIESWNENNI